MQRNITPCILLFRSFHIYLNQEYFNCVINSDKSSTKTHKILTAHSIKKLWDPNICSGDHV